MFLFAGTIFFCGVFLARLALPLQLSPLSRTGSWPQPPGQVETLPPGRTQSLPHDLYRVSVRHPGLQDRPKFHEALRADRGVPPRLTAELRTQALTELRHIHTLLPAVFNDFRQGHWRAQADRDKFRRDWERRGGTDGSYMLGKRLSEQPAKEAAIRDSAAYWQVEASLVRLRKTLLWRVGGRELPAAVPAAVADLYQAYRGVQTSMDKTFRKWLAPENREKIREGRWSELRRSLIAAGPTPRSAARAISSPGA